MADDLQEITIRSRDLLPEMQQRLKAVKDSAKSNGIALKGKSNIKVASESSYKVNNPDGTVTVFREQAANPGANNHLFHGRFKDEPIPGLVKTKTGDEFVRNSSFLNVDGDVLSAYLTIEAVLAKYGDEAGREILKKQPLIQTVKGRKVCDACMEDLPKLAAHYDIPSVLLFDEKRKQYLFWRKGMKMELMPLGCNVPVFDPTAVTVKGLVIGGASTYRHMTGRYDYASELDK